MQTEADTFSQDFGHAALPLGVRDYPAELAEWMANTEHSLLRAFRRHGYRLIRTPLIERYDALATALKGGRRAQLFHLVDPETGHPLVLRPDLTPQVGRHLAMHQPGKGPVRIAYSGPVYRVTGGNALASRERTHTGTELIGWTGAEADVEIIQLALHCLATLDLKDAVLTLGDNAVLTALLASMGLTEPTQREPVLDALGRKAFDDVLRIVERMDGDTALAARLPVLCGTPSDFQEWLKLDWPSSVQEALNNFGTRLSMLQSVSTAETIRLDFTEIRDRSYYTGIVFEAFAPGAGQAILAGGRYDGFLARFGLDLPAAGFAIDLHALADCCDAAQTTHPVIHVTGHGAESILQSLRAAGFSAALWPETFEASTFPLVKVSDAGLRWALTPETQKNERTGDIEALISDIQSLGAQL